MVWAHLLPIVTAGGAGRSSTVSGLTTEEGSSDREARSPATNLARNDRQSVSAKGLSAS